MTNPSHCPAELAGRVMDGTAPDDAWTVKSKSPPLQDRHVSLTSRNLSRQHRNRHRRQNRNRLCRLVGSHGRMRSRTSSGVVVARARFSEPIPPVLSTHEQFQAYVKAGQQAEAEEWLSRLVTAQPDDAEARELFGSLLEAKGDTAGAALQYSRAFELLLANPTR